MFFLDTGEAVFAVTAAHVVLEFFEDLKIPNVHAAVAAHGKSPMRIPLGDRIIDASRWEELSRVRTRRRPTRNDFPRSTSASAHEKSALEMVERLSR